MREMEIAVEALLEWLDTLPEEEDWRHFDLFLDASYAEPFQ